MKPPTRPFFWGVKQLFLKPSLATLRVLEGDCYSCWQKTTRFACRKIRVGNSEKTLELDPHQSRLGEFPMFFLVWGELLGGTVDGSEIPRPTTVWMYETLQMMGWTTNLNWLAGFLPSTIRCVSKCRCVSNQRYLHQKGCWIPGVYDDLEGMNEEEVDRPWKFDSWILKYLEKDILQQVPGEPVAVNFHQLETPKTSNPVA